MRAVIVGGLLLPLSAISAQTNPDPENIWPSRDVRIEANAKLPKIRIGIWDSGVDTSLFRTRLARDASGRVLLRGYDSFKDRLDTPLEVLPPALLARASEMNDAMIGLDDMDSRVQSPAAQALGKRMSAMTAAERAASLQDVERWTGYSHGTGVADAALTGNGRAEIVIARMEWWHGSPPVPCWSREMANKEAESIRDLLAFLVESGSRVVNMSWGRYERSYRSNLAKCAPQLSEEERNAIARYSVDTVRAVLRAGMTAAPNVIFLGAAGNEGQSVAQSNPATRLDLPNFVLIGAVDLKGAKASYSNAGPEIGLYANGYRIPSRLPGGRSSFGTGTSMATPLVSGTAAKMLAENPKLSGADLKRILIETAEKNADGLPLLHPARAVAAARKAATGS